MSVLTEVSDLEAVIAYAQSREYNGSEKTIREIFSKFL
jgi:hypothetical protein